MQKKKPKRFATGTKVPVAKTATELDRLLAKHGATQRATFQDDENHTGSVQFRLADYVVRITMSSAPVGKKPQDVEQAARETWRRLLLLVKAKLEIVASGMSTVEREFLADVLLPQGDTVHDRFATPLRQNYLSGGILPSLLGPAQRKG